MPILGQPMIWEERQQPNAVKPTLKGSTSPSDYQAFDQSALVKSLSEGLRSQGSRVKQQAMSQAAKMGAGRSSGAIGKISNIGADVENRIKDMSLQAAKESFAQQIAQQQFADQLALNRAQQEWQRYSTEKAAEEAEKAQRKSMWGPFAGLMS